MTVFWVVAPCRLVAKYQGFGETYSIFRAKEGRVPNETEVAGNR
jgi:hypothetical protein